MIYGALLIPLLCAIYLFIWKREEVVNWEYGVLAASGIIAILIGNYTAKYAATHDTQYVNGYVTYAEYVEPWNERVSCSHTRYTTTTDSKGRTHQHFAGYYHSYDVREHSAEWNVSDSVNDMRSVKQGYYESLVRRWGVTPEFHEMNRRYHTKDGDKYIARWTNTDETMEVTTAEKGYENRPQASPEFHFQIIENAEELGLYDYPDMNGYSMPSILGNAGPRTSIAERLLSIANSRLGMKRDARIWLLIFKNKTEDIGRLQEIYWKGGNENEFVLCIGLNDQNCAQWSHCFSWTTNKELKRDAVEFVKQYIETSPENSELKPIDLVAVVEWLKTNVDKRWVKRDFKEFAEITTEPSAYGILGAYVFTILVCAFVSFYVSQN